MGDSFQKHRTEIADICHKLYELGHVVATSGNVSVRDSDTILITPTQTRKDTVAPEQIVACNLDGAPLNRDQRPSSEITMHRSVYGARNDVNAVIHAHCPYCTVCTINNISLENILIAEQIFYTGPAPTVPYAMPGSLDQAAAVEPFITDHNSMLLERHGVLILGKDLGEAFNRIEQLEYAARITYLANAGGKPQPLSANDVEKLIRRTST